jgi:PKHD-type hydroxylase
MTNYYVRKVLEREQVDLIQNLLKHAEERNLWQDGLNSGGGTSSIKSNKELSDLQMSQTINNCIMQSLDLDRQFLGFTVAKSTNVNIVSKLEFGDYYNPHYDNWSNGDFSTTVFLNDPTTYNGGELCLLLGNDEEKQIKLDAGWAVTYPTGILHRVNQVLSGTRYVSVFWTKSKIKNVVIRNIYHQLELVIEELEKNSNSIHYTDCKAAIKDPLFITKNIQNEILRNYGE